MANVKVLRGVGKIPIHEYLDYPQYNTEVVFNRPGLYCIGDKCWIEGVLHTYPWKECTRPDLLGELVARTFPKDSFQYQLDYLEDIHTNLFSREAVKKLEIANKLFSTKELSRVIAFNRSYWGGWKFGLQTKARLRNIKNSRKLQPHDC